MRNAYSVLANFLGCLTALFSISVFAQDATSATPAKVEAAAPTLSNSAEVQTPAIKKPEANNAQAGKKMVQDATITLQTTITGNQEQPRVLYILPWQSPTTTNVDFESIDNEQKAVFDHVEREELRRELESSDGVQ